MTPSLVYYFITLALLAAYKFTDIFSPGFESFLGISIVDTLIVIVFWVIARREVAPLFRFQGVRISILLLTVAGAILAVVMVLIQRGWKKHSAQFMVILNEIMVIRNPEQLSSIAAKRKPSMMLLPYGIPIAIGTIGYFLWMGMLV